MFRSLIQALPAYGPVLLFVLICVESLGVPIPGETILVAAAAFAAGGRMSFWAVLGAALAGGVLGGMGAYWLGRSGVARLGPRARGKRLRRTAAFFHRHGGKAVVAGRFVAFVRSYLGLAAGAAGMPFRDFVVWNAVGAAVWAACFSGLGYLFGRNLPRLERGLAAAGLALAVLVAVIALVAFLVRFAWPRRAEAGAAVEWAWDRLTAAATLPEPVLPGRWATLAERYSPMALLAGYMTLGFGVSLLALWIFGALLEDAVGGTPLVRFDFALAGWLNAVATPWGVALARAISFLGSPLMLILLALSVGSRLLFRRQRIPAVGWIASLAGAALLAMALERVVRRPAPPVPEPFATGAEWSFPSPHALGGLVGYGMLAYLMATLRLERTWSRVAAVIAAVVVMLAIGASRLYLGLEYFSDVMGGYVAGVVWLGACISGVELTWRVVAPLPGAAAPPTAGSAPTPGAPA